MEQEEMQELPAIEILPPTHTKHWETKGGDITVYRLRLMTPEQIAAAGLQEYAKHLNKHTTP